MKNCEAYAALLDLYVDGELNPAEMSRVQAHLETCPACQAYVDDALAIRAAFPSVEDTVVPAGFAETVMTSIQARTASKTKKKTPWAKILLPIAACCAIVVLLQNGIDNMGKESSANAGMNSNMSVASFSIEDTDSSPASPDPREVPETAEGCLPADSSRSTSSDQDTKQAGYASEIFLPAACKDFLTETEYVPVFESEKEVHYQLTAADLEPLLAKLDAAQISYTREDGISPNSDFILVILSK